MTYSERRTGRKKGIRLRVTMTRMMPYDRDAPVIRVHSQAHAELALAAAAECRRTIMLASAPGASANIGAGYFRAMIEAARAVHPGARSLSVLDCGDRAGDVMGALREGLEAVCFNGDEALGRKLAEIARQGDAVLITEPLDGLDLALAADPPGAARAYLGG